MADEPIIGIDLGTTNSLAAVFAQDGPQLIPNALGSYLTPSAVSLDESGALIVGQGAKDRLVSHPEVSAARFKRYMGTDHTVMLGRKSFRAEQLSAMVLKSLRADAEEHLGQPVGRAVISVPAYFNDVQRKATIAAAKLAGLQVDRLVNEPTAAALAYGLQDRDGESTFLVVDLGGGTFDVSILEMFSGVMEVRASAGDAFLGGEDFTDALVNAFAEELGVKPASLDNAQRSRLRALADEAKHKLSDADHVELRFSLDGEERLLSMTPARLEEACSPVLSRIRVPIQRVMSDAGLRSDQLDRVILVGGATKMPLVRSMITKLFRRFPEFQISPDHVVALGAAVQAGLVRRHAALDDLVMTDVSPFTMGIETANRNAPEGRWYAGYFAPIIERNTVIPVSREERFQATELGQRQVDVAIYQGEAPMVRDNVAIGVLRVPLPHNAREHESFDVRFTYDTSGVLEVIVTVNSSGKQQRLVIEGNPGALTKSEIENRLKELDAIKVHPRSEAANQAMLARIGRAYENALGDRRERLSILLRDFEAVLGRQHPREIVEARTQIEAILDDLDRHDVF